MMQKCNIQSEISFSGDSSIRAFMIQNRKPYQHTERDRDRGKETEREREAERKTEKERERENE